MAKKTFKRLPNGFGAIIKLSGNRRKPWNARTPKLGYNANYSPIAMSLGCFETWTDAYECLQEWHKKNDDPSKWRERITFAECFDRAFKEKVESSNLKEKSRYFYTTPFKTLPQLHPRILSSLRLDDLQKAVDGLTTGYASKESAISMLHLVFEYATKHDYIEKDYSQFLINKESRPVTPADKFFTWEELNILKEKAEGGNVDAQMVVVMCYTGYRASAYKDLKIEDGCYIGGVKTEQSKDRPVPIHPKIMKWADMKFPKYAKILIQFDKLMEGCGFDKSLSPHATRHTFKWLCDEAKVDENTCRLLMGHKLNGDIHNRVYTHRSMDNLKEAIGTLPY